MSHTSHGSAHGISLKKRYGQHFLREQVYVDHMIDAVQLTNSSHVFEIGCGDGFLTRSLLKTPLRSLWIFEIDESWATYVQHTYPDPRMTVWFENILETDFSKFVPEQPWTLLANLPYQITFPILYRLAEHRTLLQEGVIMIQEEVAQKILKTSGRGYGFPSLYFQHYFTWRALDKVPPTAFYPPPKVQSRLLYFAPKVNPREIPDEKNFWVFVKRCFQQPRRTLKNNLYSYHYDLTKVNEQTLLLRGQQMSMDDLLALWQLVS